MSARNRGWTVRLSEATPAGRDRFIDGLRAVAMLGVVAGHWLVTGLAVTDQGAFYQLSPLQEMPGLAPASWLLQTLGLFFFVSGFAATRGLMAATRRGQGRGRWFAGRLARLARPVAVFVVAWGLALVVLALSGVPQWTRHTVGKLAFSPLWFLLVLVVLLALTPLLRSACRRAGAWTVAVPVAVVAGVDGLRFGVWPGLPGSIAMVNVLAGWLVPYLIGVLVALSGSPGRRVAAGMLCAGLAVCGVLILGAGYPASMVGVPGSGRSNLDPPSLLTVGHTLTQIGLAMLLRPLAERLLRRPACWAAVVVLNLSAMTVFVWHQTALMVVAAAGRVLAGAPPGLLDVPRDAAWIAHRFGWFPAFLLVLLLLCGLFRGVERPTRQRRAATSSELTVTGPDSTDALAPKGATIYAGLPGDAHRTPR
ncbi:acyltransferase family protein [Krasilnikovia sp. M28-CT-15]|uniref:acyltransferase family protein n=1 Tax=Krasilnikovia sp. M28-CT-15 TaxID=3373540 RepID=UPI0038760A8E